MSKFDDMYSSLIMESVKSAKIREIIEAMKERLDVVSAKSERDVYIAALENLRGCFSYWSDSIIKMINLKEEDLFEEYKSETTKLFRELVHEFAEQRRNVLNDDNAKIPTKEEFLAYAEETINKKVDECFDKTQCIASEVDDIRTSAIEFVKQRFGSSKEWKVDSYELKNEEAKQKNIKSYIFSALDASSIEDVDTISITEFKEFNRKMRAQYGFAIGLKKNIPLYTVSFDDDGKIDYISNINGSDKYLNMKRVEEDCDELLLIKNIGKYSEQSRAKRNAPKPNVKHDADWEAYQNRQRYEGILHDRRTKTMQTNVANEIQKVLEKTKDVLVRAYKKVTQIDIFEPHYSIHNNTERVLLIIEQYKKLNGIAIKFLNPEENVYSYQVNSAKESLKTYEQNIKEIEQRILGDEEK